MFNKKIAIFSAMLLILYQSALLISINMGGPVSMAIVGLNLGLISIILYFLYNKPLNKIMIYGIILMIISSSIVVYGKTKLED